MKNFDWCVYTYKHRRMFVYVAKKLIKDEVLLSEILERAKWHDVDKLVMYMVLDQRISQEHHVQIRSHHLECPKEKSDLDILETVIDYECSPYTKPDKPLNAYDFLQKLVAGNLVREDIAKRLFTVMHELNIDHSYEVSIDQEGMEYANSLGEITEEMILKEVEGYSDSELEQWIREQKRTNW